MGLRRSEAPPVATATGPMSPSAGCGLCGQTGSFLGQRSARRARPDGAVGWLRPVAPLSIPTVPIRPALPAAQEPTQERGQSAVCETNRRTRPPKMGVRDAPPRSTAAAGALLTADAGRVFRVADERSVKALQHLAIWNFSRRVGPTRPNGMLTPCTPHQADQSGGGFWGFGARLTD